jgi:predicted phosphoribosyltransferase
MYFQSRGQAGQLLAARLMSKYRYENCAVVALSDASVLVAEQIAAELHCVLTMLLSEEIDVPGEAVSFGSVATTGQFTYNADFSSGEADGYTSEYHGYLEEQKREAFSKLNQLVGDGGTIDADLLRDRCIILVSDGLNSGSALAVAMNYLKPIRTEKLIVATPLASVTAVDLVHILADEVYILDVKPNYISTDHYYSDNLVPNREETVERISEIIMKWH